MTLLGLWPCGHYPRRVTIIPLSAAPNPWVGPWSHLALSHTWHSVTLGTRSHLALGRNWQSVHLALGPLGTRSHLGLHHLALGHLALGPLGTRSLGTQSPHLILSRLTYSFIYNFLTMSDILISIPQLTE